MLKESQLRLFFGGERNFFSFSFGSFLWVWFSSGSVMMPNTLGILKKIRNGFVPVGSASSDVGGERGMLG